MDINRIFDGFMKLSEITHLSDAARRKQEQIDNVCARRCGNCDHWMKTTCKPEKELKQFKSMNSLACGAFERNWSSKDLEAKFRGELGEIQTKLVAAVSN